jgi:hydroxypyruvate reductase
MKSLSRLRADASRIWKAALGAVGAEAAVRAHVKRERDRLRIDGRAYDIAPPRRVWVIAIGKAASPMARALERVLGRRLAGGIVVTKYGHGLPLDRLELIETGHPLPDRNGVEAAERIRRLAETRIAAGDLVLAPISGGGSALVAAPAAGITLQDKLASTELLLRSSATIQEINALRKHLSWLKGGGLARSLEPATVVSLILSDVVGDDLATIASGPLAPDPTTFRECLEILDRHGIAGRVPSAVRRRLEAGSRGEIAETPKPGDPVFRRIQNVLVGNNGAACAAALREARRLGYRSLVLTSRLEGDTAEAARFHCAIAAEIALDGRPLRRPACVVSGGETTVKLEGNGKGGRNQEFALRCARPLARIPVPCLVCSLGTDGTDGPTDAAGAVADSRTLARSLDVAPGLLEAALENNDSYNFFARLGDLIITGPTRTNVVDLHVVLVG